MSSAESSVIGGQISYMDGYFNYGRGNCRNLIWIDAFWSAVGYATDIQVNNWYGRTKILSGTNNYSLTANVTGAAFICFYLRTHSSNASTNMSGFKILVSGTYYTLNDAITNNLIEKMVLIQSGTASYTLSNTYPSPLSVLSGASVGTVGYPGLWIGIVVKPGVVVSGYQYYSNITATNTGDGLRVRKTALAGLTWMGL